MIGMSVLASALSSQNRHHIQYTYSEQLILIPFTLVLLGISRHAHQINAIPIPGPIRQIVSQMRPIHAHALPVAQTSHVVPNNLLVPERRPAVPAALLQERFHIPPLGRDEEGLAGVAVVEYDVARFGVFDARVVDEGGGGPVSGVFGAVPVEVAYAIGDLGVAIPAQVLLDGNFAGAVGLGGHDGFVAHDAGGGEFFFGEEEVEDGHASGCGGGGG